MEGGVLYSQSISCMGWILLAKKSVKVKTFGEHNFCMDRTRELWFEIYVEHI